ncbi:outer membrane protein assembly factor BamB [Gammaproteobacteria bacterium]|nr:outer membrane protein assembly factor BamB [Gammaproteobacteria bacterium]
MKNITLLLFTVCAISLLPGCGIFSSDNENQPAELVKFDEEVDLRRLWRINVGNGQGEKFNRLTPALQGDILYAASNNGTVVAVNSETGRRIWRVKLDYIITGGVGVGGGMVLLGSENSQVIALNQDNGQVLWEAEVSSEVLSAPATNGAVVVAQSIDGKLSGLNAETGEQIWIYESTVPALSLRGTSSPVILNNFVIAAMANGSVVSVAIDNGTLRWDERIAIPTGRSEIERLVDIDGELYINDAGQLVVLSYQGYLAVINVTTGETRWRIQESSTVGASSGFGNIYVSDEGSLVTAYRAGQDELVWRNEQLKFRQLSSPTSFNNYVAVVDYEGYVHLLSQIDGHFMNRTRVDSKGGRSRMLSRNNTLFVYGNSGNLVALRVQQ